MEFVKHRVDDTKWIVDDEKDVAWMGMAVVLGDDAQWPMKRAWRMLAFFAVRVAVGAAGDDMTIWPWHALLWSPFYFAHPYSDWRFRI